MPRDAMPILRNARHAVIDERKLTDYVLKPAHPRGRDKARIFRSTLGYDRSSFSCARTGTGGTTGSI
jgi:hypothetical protein